MNNKFTTLNTSSCESTHFESMLHDANILLMYCDMYGKLYPCDKKNVNWLENILFSSPLISRAIKDHCLEWDKVKAMKAAEAFPGIWIVPAPSMNNGCNFGFAIGLIVTDELVDGGYLNALCQPINADVEITKGLIQSLTPIATKDVPKLASLFQYAFDAFSTREAYIETVESIGQELADSYEEINLLYTITGCMNSMSKPKRFFELTCNELLQTLPYNWVGVQLTNTQKSTREEPELFVVGKFEHSVEELSKLILHASSNITPNSTIVAGSKNCMPNELGDASIIIPLVSAGKVVGVLTAGDKIGADEMASSVDIKMLSAAASQLANFIENANLYEELNSTFMGTLEALTSSIDAKDPYTAGHSKRVALLTSELAKAAGLGEEQIARFHISGLVHDIGKIGVPENVLLKEGRLTAEEFQKVRMHPEIGARILKDIPHLEDIIEGVMSHHERFEGGGYPHGIAGYNIPLVARMIALADTFDSMSTSRTYRTAMSREDVIKEIRRVTGTQFDPALAALFLKLDFSQWENLKLDHQGGSSLHNERKAA